MTAPTASSERRDQRQVAALFVHRATPYRAIAGVELWDEARDARRYLGPDPIVAHPPCQRWGRYWHGSPSKPHRFAKGDDGGCFAHALQIARSCGGVIEHPKDSAAWTAHGLNRPPATGGWVNADWLGGWTCCVDQGWYGHPARKPTWLLAYGTSLPVLKWGVSPAPGRTETLNKAKREKTPEPFARLLIELARSVRP